MVKASVVSQSSTSRKLLPIYALWYSHLLNKLHPDYLNFLAIRVAFLQSYFPSAFPLPFRPTQEQKCSSVPHLKFLTHQPLAPLCWSQTNPVHLKDLLGMRLSSHLSVCCLVILLNQSESSVGPMMEANSQTTTSSWQMALEWMWVKTTYRNLEIFVGETKFLLVKEYEN